MFKTTSKNPGSHQLDHGTHSPTLSGTLFLTGISRLVTTQIKPLFRTFSESSLMVGSPVSHDCVLCSHLVSVLMVRIAIRQFVLCRTQVLGFLHHPPLATSATIRTLATDLYAQLYAIMDQPSLVSGSASPQGRYADRQSSTKYGSIQPEGGFHPIVTACR